MNPLKKYHDREDGFTLVELLIVVLIIGILAAIAIPIYLGIQANGYKSAVRADVNISVKRVQVGITEGRSIADIKTNQAPYTQRSVKGEVVQILDSTAAGASSSDYQVKGVSSTTSNPAGPINYSYIYDSVTGKFTESDAVVLGSSIPSTTITTSALPDATKDAAYSATVSAATTNPGGSTVYSATGLPTTLTIDSGTGKITGTPTAIGTYSVTVTASNAGVSDSKTYTLNVNSKPTITTTSLPTGDTSTAYTQTITAAGNPTPTFAVTSGTLPTGVTLGSNGTFAGTPTTTGSFNFSVTATNSGGTDVKAYTLTITQAPGITNTTLADATVASAYNQALNITGYPSPTVTITGLPSGLTYDAANTKITGTPNASGGAATASVKITATNGVNPDAIKTLSLYVNAITPTIDQTSLPSGLIGSGYSQTMTASNGSGTLTWSATGLAPGLNLDSSSGVLSGTPTGSYGNYNPTITVTASGKSSSRMLSLKIAQDLTLAMTPNSDVEYGYNYNNYWSKNNSDYTGTPSIGIDTVNFPRHGGNWDYHTKTTNNQGSFQGLTYCAPYSVGSGVRVRYGVYVSTSNSQSNASFGNGTGINSYVIVGGSSGGGASNSTSNTNSDYGYLSGDYTTTASGNICVAAGVTLNTAQDYFRDIYVDDVTIRVGG